MKCLIYSFVQLDFCFTNFEFLKSHRGRVGFRRDKMQINVIVVFGMFRDGERRGKVGRNMPHV